MTLGLYIIASEPQAGQSLLSFCLIRLLQHHFPHVGFYRPVTHTIRPEDTRDPHIQAACDFFDFTESQAEAMAGIPFAKANQMLVEGRSKYFLQQVIERYKRIESEYDVIISEGCDIHQTPNLLSFDLNVALANTLNNQIIIVINGHKKSLQEIEQDVAHTLAAFQEKQCQIFGVLVNRVMSVQVAALKSQLTESFSDTIPFLGIVPQKDILSKPNMADIAQHLNAEICWGHGQLNRMVNQTLIAAKHPSAFLAANYPQDNTLIISPGDRADTIMSCLLADQSEHYPTIAGMVLTTGARPTATIARILDGLDAPFPILATSHNTFEVAARLHEATFPTAILHRDKIHHAIEHVSQSIDEAAFIQLLQQPKTKRLTPSMFEYLLCAQASQHKQRIVLAEGEDLRVLKAAEKLILRQCVRLTLLGRRHVIEKLAQSHGLNLPGVHIVDPYQSELSQHYAERLFEARQHRGMNLDTAHDLIVESPYYATMMVAEADADGMVCGAQHTTGDTVRPALQLIKSSDDKQQISSLFVMCMSHRVVIYADCAIIQNPDANALANIAIQAANMARLLGLEPKIAMLSYASGNSSQGESVEKVRQATELVKQNAPTLMIEGPIQYDAAVDAKVAAQKMPNSQLAGQANILIFPDLDTGNNTYKAVARESGAMAIGPILLGLNKPVNDLSRGCQVDDIVNTVLITAIQAAQTKTS